jgi:hypothetical protein
MPHLNFTWSRQEIVGPYWWLLSYTASLVLKMLTRCCISHSDFHKDQNQNWMTIQKVWVPNFGQRPTVLALSTWLTAGFISRDVWMCVCAWSIASQTKGFGSYLNFSKVSDKLIAYRRLTMISLFIRTDSCSPCLTSSSIAADSPETKTIGKSNLKGCDNSQVFSIFVMDIQFPRGVFGARKGCLGSK